MKHKISEFNLFQKILCFISKGSLNIPEYRCLLIGRVQYLYTIKHAVGNFAYHRFQSISLTLLSLIFSATGNTLGFINSTKKDCQIIVLLFHSIMGRVVNEGTAVVNNRQIKNDQPSLTKRGIKKTILLQFFYNDQFVKKNRPQLLSFLFRFQIKFLPKSNNSMEGGSSSF